MTKSLLTPVMVAAAVAIGAAQARRPDFVLDVLAYPRSTPLTSGKLSPQEAVFHLTQMPRGRLATNISAELTLISLNKSVYEVGDPVVFEVDIANTGKEPLVLPWSPDDALFPLDRLASMRGYRSALMTLWAQSRGSGDDLAWLEGQVLQGSEDLMGTLQTLAPGQKARLRLPARWRASDAEMSAVLGSQGGQVQLIANVSLTTDMRSFKSANHIDVNLFPWPGR